MSNLKGSHMIFDNTIPLEEWKCGEHIVIAAPTGSGKTSFVLGRLLPYAKQKQRKIIYLCNRILLLDQVYKRAQNEYRIKFEEIEGCYDSEHLFLCTYQKIERRGHFPNYVDSNYPQSVLDKTYYCVFDEAHYFVHDSLFNSMTETVYQIIEQRSDRMVSIYMTATDDELLMLNSNIDTLRLSLGLKQANDAYSLQKEAKKYKKEPWLLDALAQKYAYQGISGSKIWDNKSYTYELASRFCIPEKYPADWKCYKQSADYSDYQVVYFHHEEELLPLIKKNPEEKWLIFSSNIQMSRILEEKINDFLHARYGAIVLDARTVHSKQETYPKKIYNEIRDDARFSCRVLIATSVLDNGVNLRDAKLKHIVLPTHDKTEFLQMIGRKRRDAGEVVTLYIRDTSMKSIAQEQYSTLKQLFYIDTFTRLQETEVNSAEAYKNGLESFAEQYSIKRPEQGIRYLLSNNEMKNRFLIPSNLNYSGGIAKQEKGQRLRDFKINIMALRRLIYQLKSTLQFQNSTSKHPVLSEQLSWIGKVYDETCWIDYPETSVRFRKIQQQLELDCINCRALSKEEYKQYIMNLMELLCEIPNPPISYTKFCKRFSSERLPGTAVFNNALEKAGIKFRMSGKQKMECGKRKYFYFIERVNTKKSETSPEVEK